MCPLSDVFREDVACQVVFGQSLLDDDVGAGLRIVQTGRHRPIPPVDRGLDGRFGERFVGGVRVVDDDNRATFTGYRGANRGNQAFTALVIRETRLSVLVGVQLKPIAPSLLIPRRFDQSAALNGVSEGQLVGIRCMQKLHTGSRGGTTVALRPCPRRQRHRRDGRLTHAGWDVDDEALDLTIDDGF